METRNPKYDGLQPFPGGMCRARLGSRSRLAFGPGNTMVSFGKFPQKAPPHRSNESHSRVCEVDILHLNRESYPQARHFAKSARLSTDSSLEFRLTGRGPGRERLHRLCRARWERARNAYWEVVESIVDLYMHISSMPGLKDSVILVAASCDLNHIRTARNSTAPSSRPTGFTVYALFPGCGYHSLGFVSFLVFWLRCLSAF